LAFVNGEKASIHDEVCAAPDAPIIRKLESRNVLVDYYIDTDTFLTVATERLLGVLDAEYFSKIRSIFASYSRRESDIVENIASSLRDTRFNVWIDKNDIRGGRAWRSEIASGIKQCDAVLFVGSISSANSENCLDELYLAREYKKPILSVFIEPIEVSAELKLLLSRFQHISIAQDFTFEGSMIKVCQILKEIIGSGQSL
jgi:TIR domain